MNREQIQKKYQSIEEGMTVRSADGEKLGTITACGESQFHIEKGFFFPKEYVATYDDVIDFREGDVYLRGNLESLSAWKDESYAGWEERSPQTEASQLGASRGPTEEKTIPLTEEQLEAEKKAVQTGEVRVHKTIKTEQKEFTVPVSKEEVSVERVHLDQPRELREGEEGFAEQTIKTPVFEEQVEVTKKPVVKEEVRISKESHQEKERISGEVRKDEVDIEKSGEMKKREKKAG